ncbi:MAG: N-acetylmuramic acid 6-phosphate etherase [Gloeomargaritaceae cyanobacterium C42_A2020_066]|nr:N-acetylmuramic acid 6-phosphate etherase [Gloeomargaritaceae cyanobacterium C42_A2020_066]
MSEALSFPAGRGHLLTEQRNPASEHLDTLPLLDLLGVINGEDQQVPGVVAAAIPNIAHLVEKVVMALEQGGRLFYVGAGTSGRLGVLDAAECPPTFSVPRDWVQGIIAGGPAALVQSAEGAEDDPVQGRQDLQSRWVTAQDVVCGIAAGSTTPYVLGALAYARELGATTAFITCNPEGSQLGVADIPIVLPVGPEVVTGSTRMKAGTATKLALNMISTATMVRLGKVYGNLMVDVQATNAKLVDRATRILQTITGLDYEAAQSLLNAAQGQVKPALVMHLRQVTYDQACGLLEGAAGRLRAVLDGAKA